MEMFVEVYVEVFVGMRGGVWGCVGVRYLGARGARAAGAARRWRGGARAGAARAAAGARARAGARWRGPTSCLSRRLLALGTDGW